MIKKEMIAMLLAGGQGSRLGVLTDNVAKPAVSFGGKYRIIDFPLSNCINSGIDTVGSVFRGIWTGTSEVSRFSLRTRRSGIRIGTPERQMPFTRTLNTWSSITLIMY